jgi:hypothetical protein
VQTMTKLNSVEDSTPNGAALDPKVMVRIGRALNARYDRLVHAPLPEKLLDLLARLKSEEQREEERGKPDASA